MAIIFAMASFSNIPDGNSFYAEPTLAWNPCYRYTVSESKDILWEHGEKPEHGSFDEETTFDGVEMGRFSFLRIEHSTDLDEDDSEFLESDGMNPCWAALLKVIFRAKGGQVMRYIGLRHEIQPVGVHGLEAVAVRDKMLDQFRSTPLIAAQLVGATEHRYGFDYCEPYRHHIAGIRLGWHSYVVRQKWVGQMVDGRGQEADDQGDLGSGEEDEEEANLSPPEEEDDDVDVGEEVHPRGSRLQFGLI